MNLNYCMNKKNSAEIGLFIAALVLIFLSLGAKNIWTQEYRWWDICQHMLNTKDYWHPYLDGKAYYDKPLLSYWMIVALAKLHHGVLTKFILRLPSALASLSVLWSVYWLSKKFFDRETALLAGWFLLTTFYFIFWARVASADMLNVAAIMLSLVWYFAFNHQRFYFYLGWYVLLAIGALLKGLIAPVIVVLVLLPDLLSNNHWRDFLCIKSIMAILIALALYLLPFMISSHTKGGYTENGLFEVFRENILRFFQPFDHQGPWYTYFIYFPVYTLPWTPWIFQVFIRHLSKLAPVRKVEGGSEHRTGVYTTVHEDSSTEPTHKFSTGVELRKMSIKFLWVPKNSWIFGERFLLCSVFSIFIFLSLSGSRRSYYILPIIPFSVMLLSHFCQQKSITNPKWQQKVWYGIYGMYILLCAYFIGFEICYWL